jgi:tetratricopeptide (TPR) repeat protein
VALLAGGIALGAAGAQTTAFSGGYREDAGTALNRHLKALADSPRSLSSLLGAAKAALELGDAQAAVTFYARAEEIAPRDGRIKAGIGAAFLAMEQPASALRFLDEARGLGVPEGEIAADRGLAHDLLGDSLQAQRDYAIALRSHDNDELRRRLALSRAITGDRGGALAAIDDQVRRKDMAGWRVRAFVLALTGDTDGATTAARAVMPHQAAAMQPFFARLPSLRPADRAMAVHFGHFPGDAPASTFQAPQTYAGLSPNVTSAGRPNASQPALGRPNPGQQPTGTTAQNVPSQQQRTQIASRGDRALSQPVTGSTPARIQPPARTSLAPAVPGAAQRSAARTQPPASPPPTRTEERPSFRRPVDFSDRFSLAGRGRSSSAADSPARATPVPGVAQPSRPVATTSTLNSSALAQSRLPALTPPPTSTEPARTVAAPPASAAAPVSTPTAGVGGPTSLASTSTNGGSSTSVASPPAASSPAPASTQVATVRPEAVQGPPDGNSRPNLVSPSSSAPDPRPAEPAPTPGISAVMPSLSGAAPDSPAAAASAPPPSQPTQEPAAKPTQLAAAEPPKPSVSSRLAGIAATIGALPAAEPTRPQAAPAKPAAEAKKATASAKSEPAGAPSRHWVQVAGVADKDELPREFARIRTRAPKLLAGKAAWTTPLRFTNRLLVGPFKSDEEAQDFVNELAKVELSAFTWTSPAGQEIVKLAAR